MWVPISKHGCTPSCVIYFINNYRRKAKQSTIFDNTPNEFLLNQNQGAVANEAIADIKPEGK